MHWRNGALAQEDKVILAAALVAAHVSYHETGFRQRDLKFFFDLFLSWTSDFFHAQVRQPNNMQIARVLRALVSAKHTKISRSKKVPRYRLTQTGLLSVLQVLATPRVVTKIEESIFVLYFLSNYRDKLHLLSRESVNEYTRAAVFELEGMLDVEEVRRRILTTLEQRIALFKKQAAESREASARAKELQKKGSSAAEISLMLQKNFPYHLNAQRPLQELYSDLPSDLRLWEITEGPGVRTKKLWEPMLSVLEAYREIVKSVG